VAENPAQGDLVLKINRKVEYGLVALKHMQGKPKGDLTSVREICDAYKTPFDPLAHVLRILNSKGVLKSEQGAHGGYRLMEDLENISLAQFIKMIEGQLAWTDCARHEEDCKCSMLESCNIITPMHEFNGRLISFLESISIAEVLQVNGGMLDVDLSPAEGAGSAT
jgi:Rrf2 family protein